MRLKLRLGMVPLLLTERKGYAPFIPAAPSSVHPVHDHSGRCSVTSIPLADDKHQYVDGEGSNIFDGSDCRVYALDA